ncbi:MAG: hypothetical protein ACK5LL_17075 [Suipraeoptans sp.]
MIVDSMSIKLDKVKEIVIEGYGNEVVVKKAFNEKIVIQKYCERKNLFAVMKTNYGNKCLIIDEKSSRDINNSRIEIYLPISWVGVVLANEKKYQQGGQGYEQSDYSFSYSNCSIASCL